MKEKYKVLLCIIIFISAFTLLNNKIVKAQITDEKIYKIGVINFAKYVELNEDGKPEGYYIDLFDLIAKELNLNYEYVFVNNSESISKLQSGELDFCLGITITESRIEKVLFNSYPIALEKFALYTDKNINPKNLNHLNGLTFGTIHERATDWILDFFKASNIYVETVYRDTYQELNDLLDNRLIDLVLDSAYKDTNYNKAYEFVGSQVYIAANKNNKELINEIDNTIVKEEKRIDDLYNSYFDLEKLKKEKLDKMIEILVETIFLIILIRIFYPIIKKKIARKHTRKFIKSNNYLIYYNPIYQAKNKEIVGFEAILKDKIKNKYLVNSKEFYSEWKDYDSICDLCIWKLKTVITDYEKITKLMTNDFYLSLNMPIHQLEHKKFVDRVIDLLNKSKLNENSICIEFSGNIPPKNMEIIKKSIKRLKEAGFIIAIDNFGIEYSNLNLIHELDLDIIKIDRTFTLNMEKNIIKNEIIMFISRIGKAQNKSIVLEGIDQLDQDKKIKEIKNNHLFVQGFFYSKPVTIENIKDILK